MGCFQTQPTKQSQKDIQNQTTVPSQDIKTDKQASEIKNIDNPETKGYDEYIGKLQEGKKHGYGILKYRNGDKYQGQWSDDIQQGKGDYQTTNGSTYDGD